VAIDDRRGELHELLGLAERQLAVRPRDGRQPVLGVVLEAEEPPQLFPSRLSKGLSSRT
jgi:hypothetical protein